MSILHLTVSSILLRLVYTFDRCAISGYWVSYYRKKSNICFWFLLSKCRWCPSDKTVRHCLVWAEYLTFFHLKVDALAYIFSYWTSSLSSSDGGNLWGTIFLVGNWTSWASNVRLFVLGTSMNSFRRFLCIRNVVTGMNRSHLVFTY